MLIRYTDIETGKMQLSFTEYKALAEKSEYGYFGHFRVNEGCTIYPQLTIEEDDFWEDVFKGLRDIYRLMLELKKDVQDATDFKLNDQTLCLIHLFICSLVPSEYSVHYTYEDLEYTISAEDYFDEQLKYYLEGLWAEFEEGVLQGFYFPKSDIFQLSLEVL